MEPFGASGREVREAKCLKDMVGTRRLELLTSTVSIIRFYNDLQVRGDCLSTRKSCKTSHFVGWVVGWKVQLYIEPVSHQAKDLFTGTRYHSLAKSPRTYVSGGLGPPCRLSPFRIGRCSSQPRHPPGETQPSRVVARFHVMSDRPHVYRSHYAMP